MEQEKISPLLGAVNSFSFQSSFNRKRKRKEPSSEVTGEIERRRTVENENSQSYHNHSANKVARSKSITKFKNRCTHSQRNRSSKNNNNTVKRKEKLSVSKMSTWSKVSISLAIYYLSSKFYHLRHNVIDDISCVSIIIEIV